MHRARRPAATSASRRVNGQSTQRLSSGRIVKTSTQLNKREIRALKNLEFERETHRLAGLTNAQRHAEEAHLDLPDDDYFNGPLADVLEGNALADISHAGEDLTPEQARVSNRELWQALRDSHSRLFGRRTDHRTRRDRTQSLVDGFKPQMEATATAYLDFSLRTKGGNLAVLDGHPDEMAINHYPLIVVDLFSAYQAEIPMFDRDEFVASGLVNLGLFPCSPYDPTVAITTRALEVFRVTRLRCPRLGIQPYVRALCDLHGVPFRTYLSTQFSIAFDVYLGTLAIVAKRVKAALGRDTSNWRLKNACPACLYKLEGEDELLLPVLTTQDGNNSLSRHGQMERTEYEGSEEDASAARSRAREDDRQVPGDYYLSRSEVDKWATEGLEELMKGHSSDPEWNEEEDGCSERWSNMREEITSRALGMYDETGIFLSLCRHGFVLVVLDMIQSGELAKYGFAVVNHLLKVIGQVAAGYDIGCKFGKMINAHPVLGPLAREKGFKSLVGAFHGHAHNRRCQLCHLATYVEGVGLEDLEECESFFSKSNALAPCTRYATAFHHQQAIVSYLQHTDIFDTYQSLSLLLVTKYKRALEVRRTWTALKETMRKLGVQDVSVFEEWLKLEKAYLDELSTEPLEETLKMEYYQKLVNLDEAEARLSALRGVVTQEDPSQQNYQENLSATRRLETQRRHAMELRDKILLAVQDLEMRMDVRDRWTPGCTEWSEAAVLVANREATKCASILLKRFKSARAIKTAIEQYNAAAAALEVPREPLSWEEVVDYTFLSDFDLLRTSRRDILTEGWAQPAGREAMDNYFKILRANEEIKRLNIEIPRFVTYMRDEEAFLRRQEERVRLEHGDALAYQVTLYREQQGRFNDGHRYRLLALSKLPGFTGSIMPGVPVDKQRLAEGVPQSQLPHVPEGFDGTTLGDEDEEDSDGEAETLNATFVVLRITEDTAE
ncbi:hypothetical protein MVEN_00725800 [Mycena venus]|uniref:CxC1-like cysteine cluster associated with KDZ transposases domain-containing protein n=1 Tax=Mycena venus TaxID=2733690 RepID=A0A8H6YF31_9AGAR|nr:hypothetical protein MVEN_00725800 [Mycena venus]